MSTSTHSRLVAADKQRLHQPIMNSPLISLAYSEKESTSIRKWFSGRSILVTGATGFMGKVLLEKLLRSCPGLKNIYLIVRPKRGMAPNSRINEMVKLPLFQQLRENNPSVLKKLVAIEGDTTVENLGISEENIKLLYAEVSVVFHAAATLRLEAVLKDAVIHNLVGSENLFKFCRGMKKLEALVHMSTAFCHCDVKVLEEKIYPPTRNPKHILNIVEWMDDKSLELITPSIIEPHPNTYTFTKRLAETLAYEYGKELPVIILRPSIVTPTMKEPMPGWVDSLNGPVGVLAAAGKGVIRSMLVEADNHAEVIPVDIAINLMIICAWHRAIHKSTDTLVYNLSQSEVKPITWGEILNRGKTLFQENPFDWPLWYPDGNIRTNKLVHNIIVFLFQVIPAYFMDVIFAITMQKIFMVRIQKRIKLGMHFLQYFTLREWKFRNNELMNIVKLVPKDEQNIFYSLNLEIHVNNYLKDIILGTRKYCLKESPDNIPWAKRYLTFLYVLDRVCKVAIIFGLIWLLLKISNVAQLFHDNYYTLIQKV